VSAHGVRHCNDQGRHYRRSCPTPSTVDQDLRSVERVKTGQKWPRARANSGSRASVVLEVDVLVFDATPETLDEDVVQRPTAPVHADGDPFAQEHLGEGGAGELRTLVGLEDVGPAIAAQGVFQAVDAELRLQGVGQPPGQHATRVPVDDGDQVDKPMRQADVGDISAPYLVGPGDDDTAQQVGIDLVFGVRLAGARPRRHAGQPQHPHQPLDPLAVDRMALLMQMAHHASTAVERVTGILRVDQSQDRQALRVQWLARRGTVDPRTCDARQLALPTHRQLPVALDPVATQRHRLSPDFFFNQSNSTFSRPISL